MPIDSFAAQAASNSETSLSVSVAQTPRSAQLSVRRPGDRAGDDATARGEAGVETAPTPPRNPRPRPPAAHTSNVSLPPSTNAVLPQAPHVPGAFPPGTREPLDKRAEQKADALTNTQVDMRALMKRLSDELGEDVFERYFLGQAKLAMRGSTLCVTVTSTYLSQLIDRRFGEQLRRATGATSVKFEVDRSVFTAQAVAISTMTNRDASSQPVRTRP